jgi:transcription antitermination factor NusG
MIFPASNGMRNVRSRREFSVRDMLNKISINVFLPSFERMRQWEDRKKKVAFPLFPGYLFVGIGVLNNEKLAVIKTQGVVGFVGRTPGEPENVPFELINELKKNR